MNSRSDAFLSLRPHIGIKAQQKASSLRAEAFQNNTLRPILKLQNELLILMLEQYFAAHKNTYYRLTLPQRMIYIAKAIQKDMAFKNALKGVVIGCFTAEEFKVYTQNTTSFNKRIMQLLIERYQSQIQYFEFPNT